MKATLLLVLFLSVFSLGYSQTVLYHENFEQPSGADSVSSQGTPVWAITTALSASGTQSIKNVPSTVVSDTLSLVTASFSTTGLNQVFLNFSHICKIQYSDHGIVEVSGDGGLTWNKLTVSHYLGTSQFGSQNATFNDISYLTDWVAGTASAIPTNSWWRSEVFDISAFAGNKSNVKVRFRLYNDASSFPGPDGYYGWLIDNIEVTGSPSETYPPVINMITAPSGSVYGSAAIKVDAIITDGSGVDTARLTYSITNGISDTIGMIRLTGDTFRAYIPFPGYGRTFCYKVIAKDASSAANIGTYPATGCASFMTAFATGGTVEVGTGINLTSTYSYPTAFENYWYQTWQQYLYTKAELNALGIYGGELTSIAMKISTLPSPNTLPIDYNVKIGTTTNSSLSTFTTTGLTNVYGPTTVNAAVGWNTINFTTPFVWDGNSNIIFDLRQTGDYGSANAATYYTTTSYNSVLYAYSSSDNNSFWSSVPTATTSTSRPNMRFAFTVASSLSKDLGMAQIITPTVGTLANTNTDVKVKIKNFGLDTITSATINWKLDGVLKTPFSWTGQLLKDSTSGVITIGNFNLPGGNHTIDIWTSNPNGVVDQNWANDQMSYSFYTCANQLSGTYTIGGTNPDFATFNNALIGLTQCGITGPVTFNVAAGTYTEQLTIPAISGSSATNTITFKSANNDSTSVELKYDASGVADNWVLKLNGASFINFKGITINPIDSTYATAIQFANNSSNISLKNNVLKGTYFNLSGNDQAIVKSLSTSKDSNIIIENNIFYGGYNALVIIGTSTSNLDYGITVSKNSFKNQSKYNAYFENISALNFDKNIVFVDSSISSCEGIYLKQIKDQWMFTNNNIKIYTGSRAINVWNCNSYGNPALFANNMIAVGGSGTHVMDYANGTNINFYYNTFNRNSSSSGEAFFINETSGTTDSLTFYNNIFANTGSVGYAIYFNFAKGTKKLVFDNNNYYSKSTNFGYFGSAINSFAAWKSYTAQDVNSLGINPYFGGIYDLHVFNNLLNGTARAISTITTDIDGDTRNSTTPDIGADEFIASPKDLIPVTFAGPTTICGLGNTEVVKLKIKNIGSTTVNGGFTASYQIVGTTTPVTENVTSVLNSGDTIEYTFTTPVNLNVFSYAKDSTFKFITWVNLPADNVHENDTLNAAVLSGYKPLAPTVNDTTINYGTAANLTVQNPLTVSWYQNSNSTQAFITGPTYNTGLLYDTTKYWVDVKSGVQLQQQLGTGTNVNSTTGYPSPYSNYYGGTKHQMLIRASELTALGFSAGKFISIGFEVASVGSTFSGILNNFQIDMGQTTNTVVSSSSYIGGLTNVLPAQNVSVAVGINTHVLATPFVWDGVSNVVVQTSYSNGNSGTTSDNVQMKNTDPGFLSTNYNRADNATASAILSNSTPYSTSNARPNMIFIINSSGVCASSKVAISANVVNYPTSDAGILRIASPSANFPAGVGQPIKVKIKNYSPTALTSLNINYSINGVAKPAYLWTGSLGFKDSTIVTIDSLPFLPGVYQFKAYSSLPNGSADLFNLNDTVFTTYNAQFNGLYTIGDTTAGAHHYPSLVMPVSTLNTVGVYGPTTFALENGTYNGKVALTNIPGVSSTNTITIQSISGDSSLVILQDTNTTTSNYVLYLNGTGYTTIKNITVRSIGSTRGYALFVQGPTTNNTVQNCNIISAYGTTNYFGGIMASGLNNKLTIKNNRVTYGYYGIYTYGTSTTSLATNNSIIDNVIDSFYYYGIYTYYQDSLSILRNTLNSAPQFATGSGIYSYFSKNKLEVNKNKLFIRPTSTGTVYGININNCPGSSTSRGLISNNFISIFGQNTSSEYDGIYSYSSDYMDYIHNSVNIQAGGSTSKAIYLTSYYSNMNTTNIFNNYMRNSSSGYAYYVGSTSSVKKSDFNNLYSNGTNLAYYTANKTNLASFVSALAMDSSSVSLNVPYFDSLNLHVSTAALSGRGQFNARVTSDIDGLNRSLLPTIGAVEIAQKFDLGITKVVISPTTGILGGDLISVKMVIKNFGTDSIDSIPVGYVINGTSTPVTGIYPNYLKSGQSDTVYMSGFNAPDGNSSICGYTNHNLDTNTYNNQSCTDFYGFPNKDARLLSVLPLVSGCALTTDSIRIKIINNGGSVINGNLTASYMVGNSTPISQSVPNIINPGDTSVFTFSIPVNLMVTTNDSTFTVHAWVDYVGDNVHTNDTAVTSTISYHPAIPPTVSNVSCNYGSSVTITASTVAGQSLAWYTDSISNNILSYDSTLTTGTLYNDTAFWVNTKVGIMSVGVFGTGTSTNTSTGYPAPYTNYFGGTKHQILVRASELLAEGYGAGPIQSISFYVASVGSTFSGSLQNFTLAMANTNDNVLSGSSFISGLTNVIPSSTFTVNTGWNTHTLTTPFIWDGVSNLVIQTSYSNGNSGISTDNVAMRYSTTSFNSTNYYYADSQTDSYILNATSPSGVSTNRPNMMIKGTMAGCSSERVKVKVTLTNATTCDIGIDSLITPITGPNLTTSEVVKVRIKNYSSSSQSNFNINYSINGGSTQTTLVTGIVQPFDTLSWSFTQPANLSSLGSNYSFKIWTTLTCDSIHFNDTLYRMVKHQLPAYCTPTYSTGTGDGDYLGRVKLESLDNITTGAASPFYTYYGSMGNVFLSKNVSYTLTVSPGTYSGSNVIAAWIDYNRDGDFADTLEKIGEVTVSSAYPASSSINFTVPSFGVDGTVRLRVREVYSNTNLDPCANYTYGETEDYDITLNPLLPKDASVDSISAPSNLVLANSPVDISTRIKNVGSDTIQIGQLSVNYFLNNNPGTPKTNAIKMAPGDTLTFSFTNITFNTGYNTLCFKSTLSGDTNLFNNEKCKTVYGQFLTTLPFCDNLDGASDNWYHADTIWQRGTPAGTTINTAHSAPNAYMTVLNGNYPNSSNSTIVSPQLNFTGLNPNDTAILKVWYTCNSEAILTGDGTLIEYSVNNGTTWLNLTYMNDGSATNGYNHNVNGSHCWAGNIPWTQFQMKLDPAIFNASMNPVLFRFRFISNSSVNNFDGFAFDDFCIEIPVQQTDAALDSILLPNTAVVAGSSQSVKIRIKNNGVSTLTSIPVHYRINNTGNQYTDVWTGNLQSGATDVITIAAPFIVPSVGSSFSITAAVNVAADGYGGNDSISSILGILPPPIDAGITEILNPHSDTTDMNVDHIVVVRIKNFGSTVLTSVPVQYKVGTVGSPVVETWTGNLAAGTTVDYTFTQTYKPLQGGWYALCAKTNVTNDGLSSNDQKCVNKFGGIGMDDIWANTFTLDQNRPNPSSDNTEIGFTIPVSGNTTFTLVDMIGQTMYSETTHREVGSHFIKLNTSELPQGVYYYSVAIDGHRLTKKMVVLK